MTQNTHTLTRPTAPNGLASIEEIIEEASRGRMFLLVDDEDRENEGDLVIPAQFAGPEQIAFMARHGRGLICLALTAERTEWLGLRPMNPVNNSRHSTAFTVSIEARTGIDTGISAHDRARTISVAIDPQSTQRDLVSPGHVFPLTAREGGTLVRAGHTEAAVDVARLAGLDPSGVICEVMKDDGTMARLPDLLEFAAVHGLKVATIADLIAYRRRSERLVECVRRSTVTDGDDRQWALHIFRDRVSGIEHIALTMGDLATADPALVRIQVEDSVAAMVGDGSSVALARAMDRIAVDGRGAVIMIRGVQQLGSPGAVGTQGGPSPILKDFGIGAQILVELGMRDIRLLVNTRRAVIALEGFGLHVREQIELA